jgi:hypothetical protein
MDLPSDLIDLLSAFADEQVDYLLVGGQAVALHGVPRFTKDADLWLRDSHDNLERAKRSLAAFGAPSGTLRALDEAQGLDVVWMGHPPARIDLMKEVPGGDFEAAFRARATFVVANVQVSCVSKADLIAQKRASGRPQDLVDAANLERC